MYFQILLVYISFLILYIKSYIVIPLKSTDDLYFSKLSINDITIDNKEIISEIFQKYINNVLYTDLIISEPNQKVTAFILPENFGFYFYEEYSAKELKELGYINYNSFSRDKSETLIHSDELNYNYSFWSYLSYEDFLYLYKYDDKDTFNLEKLKNSKMSKTNKRIHFLYSIRHSSKIPNTTDFINMKNKLEKEKDELRKLNFKKFSYFSIGLHYATRSSISDIKSFIEEFYSKNEISNKYWNIYYINDTKSKNNNLKNSNDFKAFLILGSSPHIYLSNTFKEKEQFSTFTDKISWDKSPTLSFYDVYTKMNNSTISLVKFDKSAQLNFNLEIIKSTWYVKTVLEEKYFNNLINQGKCFESRLNKTEYSYYAYYYCDKNKITEEEIKNFPVIYFQHNEFSFIFQLNSNDLIESFGDVIIFKIVFDTSNYWVLGKIFLRKYMFSFNDEDKKVYFYNKNYGENEDDDGDINDYEKNKYLTLQIIVIIICVITFSILGFFIGKFFYNKKKVVTHELVDIDENFNDSENKANDKENLLFP